MNWRGFEITCPHCRGALSGDSSSLRCDACNIRYPVELTVPDLRVFADPYISMEDDRAKGRRLAARFGDFDFGGLVAYYYSITPAVKPNQARMFTAGVLAARARAAVMLELWQKEVS